MTLIGKELATDTMLDKVLCVCSGRRPIETCTEGLTYKGPSRGVVTTEASMAFSQELPSFFFGDTSLKDSGSAFLVELSVVNLVGLRTLDNAAGLILILREFSPIKVGQEGFGPWGNDCHDEMRRWCYVGVSGIWGYVSVWTSIAIFPLPHHGWLKEPFQEDIRWDGVAFSAHASKDVRGLITLSSHVMKLEPSNRADIFMTAL